MQQRHRLGGPEGEVEAGHSGLATTADEGLVGGGLGPPGGCSGHGSLEPEVASAGAEPVAGGLPGAEGIVLDAVGDHVQVVALLARGQLPRGKWAAEMLKNCRLRKISRAKGRLACVVRAAHNGPVNQQLLDRFSSQLSRGEIVLFTGAGFSMAARNSGGAIPSVSELRSLLWELAFPGEAQDEGSTLGDLFDVAVRRSGNRVRDLLQARFRVDPRSLPDAYQVWFSMPWYRMYTLNVDDLDTAADRQFTLPRPIKSVSALADAPPPTGREVLSVHLNGRAADYPDVTFSARDYASRTARPDPWYQHLIADVLSRPVLFIGTSLDEPPLWHHLEMRRTKGGRGRKELRPGSYLVTPNLPAARRAILEDLNIDLIPMDQEAFAEELLQRLSQERDKGLSQLDERRQAHTPSKALMSLSELRTETQNDAAEFLLGREPTWSDLTDGFAVVREFEEGLKKAIDEASPQVVAITGTAGVGKSTTLMRLALEYQANGKDVRIVAFETGASLGALRRQISLKQPDVLVIDDVDVLGESTSAFLTDVVEQNQDTRLILGLRSTRYENLGLEDWLRDHGVEFHQTTVPNLEDQDINLILDALEKANRLGRLKGMGLEERRHMLRNECGRQLLVAMIQATSGERFEEKVDSECRELGGNLGLVYAIAALATGFRTYVTRDELLIAMGGNTNEALNDIEGLVRQKLLRDHSGQLIVRHRVIADRALNYFQREGQLDEAVRGLLFAMSTKAHWDRPRNSREQRLLVRLVNHEWLLRTIGRDAGREAYVEVESQLSWDCHYWLHRGALEVEAGDLSLAQNFLDQARGLAPEDYKVQTEWAYMQLKRAAQDAPSLESEERAMEAIAELEDAVSGRGAGDAYPYHVLGSQSLSWVRRANLQPETRARILRRLLDAVKEGVEFHPRRQELRQLQDDLEREYLMTAVQPSSSADGDEPDTPQPSS